MNRTVDYFKMRAEMLEKRDANTNKRIIAKLMRKIRQLEKTDS